MAIINKSNTKQNKKDYWRTSPELINDALKLLNIRRFGVDVCCSSGEVKIEKAEFCITEDLDALRKYSWFLFGNQYVSFCNPPFSKKWEFFQKAVEQVNRFRGQVLMVLPYTPVTKAWQDNIHGQNCIIYVPDGRYQYLLPNGKKSASSCNFETCLVLIVPFKCGNVIVNYKRGLKCID